MTTVQTAAPRKPHKTLIKPQTKQIKPLTAETVTTIATDFLKRIGHRGGLKPKKATLQDHVYTVEVEFKKQLAIVKVDVATREIKEYEIQPKAEEASTSVFSERKQLILSIVVPIIIYFVFKFLGI